MIAFEKTVDLRFEKSQIVKRFELYENGEAKESGLKFSLKFLSKLLFNIFKFKIYDECTSKNFYW